MANWTVKSQPFGANRAPLLTGLSALDGLTPVPVAVDPTTGSLLTSGGSGGGGNVNISQVGGATFALGQATMAGSLPVTIASDNTGPVEIWDGTNRANIGAVTGKNGLYVMSNSATGSTVPANAFFIGGIGSGSNLVGVSVLAIADGQANQTNLLATAQNAVFNGTTWDKLRSNTTGVIVAAGTTSTQTGVTLTTFNAKRFMALVNITAGAGSVTIAINAVSASGYTTNLLTSTALTGVGTTALRIFDGATPSANLVANDTVPRTVSITATVSGSITYGIDYLLGV